MKDKKYICISECPELDMTGIRHCIDTKEGIIQREEEHGDYCPVGNKEKWEEIVEDK